MDVSLTDTIAPAFGIPGWLTPNEGLSLASLACAVRPGDCVVEIGSWKGRSTAVFGLACKGMDIPVVAVDHFLGSPSERGSTHAEAASSSDGIYPEWERNMMRLGLIPDPVQVLRGDLAGFGDVPLPPVGLLFIDCDHGKEETLRAYRAWAPRLAPGAVVAFHDMVWPGVLAAIAHLGLDPLVEGNLGIVQHREAA